MNLENLNELIIWIKKNINIHNTQLPVSVLSIIKDCTQERITDRFLTFGMVAYAVKAGIYDKGDLTKDKLANDEASLYIYRLFLSFVLEKLRRLNIIKFEPVSIFDVKEMEKKEISVIGSHYFIENELKGKTLSYREFVKVFW